MNKFQQERAHVLKHKQFSEERKNAVLTAMQTKKSKRWIPATLIVMIVCAALFLMLPKEQTEAPTVQSYSEASLKQQLIANYFSASADSVEFPYIEMGVKGNDAIVVTYFNDILDSAMIHYATYQNNQWTFEMASSFTLNEQSLLYHAFTTIKKNNLIYAAGKVPQDYDKVVVGELEATTFKLGAHTVWIAPMNSAGTPVYYEVDGRDGSRFRVQEFMNSSQPTIPFVEPVGDDYVTKFWVNDMHIGDEEYSKYGVVIDPTYYVENAYQGLDVIVVEFNGQTYLTRIITAGGYNVDISVKEGTILQNGQPVNHYFGMGRWDGDPTIYHNEMIDYGMLENDQVFVMPDNWASDGIRGFVDKTQIVGKVIGYSKPDLSVQWTEDEIAIYWNYKENYDDKLLEGLTPQDVVRMQRYAEYVGDYRTMYELYSEQSMTRSYEEWFEFKNMRSHVPNKAQLNYEAYMLAQSLHDAIENKVVMFDENGNIVFSVPVELEDDSWKVKYETVIRVYN